MKRFILISLAVLVALTMTGVDAFAGAKVQINDDAKIDIGFRIQTLFFSTEENVGGDLDRVDDFMIRRGRLRLGGSVTDKVSFFLQTDVRTGTDMHMIDAFIKYKLHKLATVIVGQNMAPVLRQNATSSGGLMAIDRPGIVYKNLTWGTRAKVGFTNTTAAGTNAGFFGISNGSTVRDMGVTLFGSDSINDELHFKYYLGVYDGVQEISGEDNFRYVGRAQLNFFDAEAGYYGLSTYLGKKKTVGIGVAFDTQDSVITDSLGKDVDYTQYTIDLFADYPVGPGSLTFEAAYIDLDLDDAKGTLNSSATGEQVQGDGFYVQAGYFINNWQPWVEYEEWSSDDSNDIGSYDSVRVGLNYYIAGHSANIKVGYEQTNYDNSTILGAGNEDSVDSYVVGFYVTY